MTYFETNSSKNNQSAKYDCISDLILLISKIICVLIFSFFSNNSSEWVLIGVTLVFSAAIFYTFYDEKPYYDDKMSKLYLSATGIFFWNSLILFLGKILENTSFDGSLPLFFIGVPLILLIIIELLK